MNKSRIVKLSVEKQIREIYEYLNTLTSEDMSDASDMSLAFLSMKINEIREKYPAKYTS